MLTGIHYLYTVVKMKPNIDRQSRPVEAGTQEAEARGVIRAIGESFRPGGFKYMGSMVVHMYDGILTATDSRTFVSQLSLGDADEPFADLAIKELAKAAMRSYGRKEKAGNT